MIRAEPTDGTCSACGEAQRVIDVTIGATTVLLCRDCGAEAGRLIGDKLSILHSSVPSSDQVTSDAVASFATYPHDLLLDELVMCAVRYRIGPLDADERRIATALLERMAALGIAHKAHRPGCEIWPKYRLCECPWQVPS